MSWLSFSLLGYFFNAFATLLDKHLLSRRLPNAAIYTFYTGILSIGVVVLVPFGFSILPARTILLAFLAGTAFLVSFYFYYRSLRIWDASRVSPLVGIFSAIISLLNSQIVMGEHYTSHQLLAFAFLLGAALVLVFDQERGISIRWDVLGGVIIAAFFLSTMFALSKLVYRDSPFLSGFIWIRMGSALAALFLLIPQRMRKNILYSHAKVKKASMSLVVLNKVIGAVGFVVINYAVSLGSGALVNVLRSSEYVCVFLLVLASTALFPGFVHEKISRNSILQKSFGILLAGIGISFLLI